jgi:transcriptional regulator with XRE-family HTH domain
MDTPPLVLHALTSPRGRVAVASGNTGAILRVVRQELRLRQADVAARSGYSQATISRLEQGQIRDRTVTGDVADALGIPADVFSGLAGGTTLTPRVEDVERREMLKAALAVASAAMLPAAVVEVDQAKRLGASAVTDCWRALGRLHMLEAQYGGAAVYELTAGMAARLQSAVGSATYSAVVGRNLRQVTAATMIQAGWQAYDARRRDVARHWWLETLHLADLGGGVDEYRISALASLSREATDGVRQGRDAIELAQTAGRIKGTSPRMLSLLAAREALGHAAVGDRVSALACLRRSHRALDQSTGTDDPVWMNFWGPSDLAIHEMHAARLGGDTMAAERSARDAVANADVSAMPRNHAIYAAHLGSSLAQVGKYDEAISVSRQVLGSTVRNGSYRVRAELRETARLLAIAPYPAGRAFATTIERLVPAV